MVESYGAERHGGATEAGEKTDRLNISRRQRTAAHEQQEEKKKRNGKQEAVFFPLSRSQISKERKNKKKRKKLVKDLMAALSG